MTLAGRGVIVTGASRGLGLEVARSCVRLGADVVVCARSARRSCTAAAVSLREDAGVDQRIVDQVADVADPEQVAALVERAVAELRSLTGVVNNAGRYGPKGPLEDADWDDWTRTLAVNLGGTALVSRAVLPHFRRAGYGKVVNLSGGGATSALPMLSAYAASKAAVVRLTETLAQECLGAGVDVNAVAPGALDTAMLDEVLDAGPERLGAEVYERFVDVRRGAATPLAAGAGLVAFLLSAASDGITGRLISAVWDEWADLPERRDQLAATDVYTLRRIVPADRGLDW